MPDLETIILSALFGLFLLCLVIQLYFLLTNHSKLAGYAPKAENPEISLPISVIISARNEAHNLTENLPSVLNQNYPDFEVIVINDCSSDSSDMVLMDLQANYPRLKVVTITEHARFKTGKKFALTLGIKSAANEYLLFTDADCKPASDNWITRMASNFSGRVEIVLGYSPYNKTHGLLNSFIRFETLKTAVNYLSAALNGDAYMGIGRNLAYTKSLFFSSKGFASHIHVLSGDDDLFVNENATPDNIAIEIDADSFVYTDAKSTFSSWFRQKKRHFGAGKLYKSAHKLVISLDAISGFLFYVLLIICLILKLEPILLLGLFIFRLVIQLVIYRKIFNRLNGRQFLWYLPLFDMFYYLYINIFGLIGSFIKSIQWK